MFGLLQTTLSHLHTMKYSFQQNNVPKTSWDPHYNSAFFAEVYLLLTWKPNWSFWEDFLLIYTTMQHRSHSISSHRGAGESRTKRKMCQYPSLPPDKWPAVGFGVFWHWSCVLHACMGKTKASRDHVKAACHKLWRGLYLKKPECVPKRQDPCLEEKEQCATPCLWALPWYYSSFLTIRQNLRAQGTTLTGLYVSCMWAWDLLSYLFLRAKLITPVMWGECDLDRFVSEAIFHPTWAPLRFSLVFPWEDTDCPLFPSPTFPFLSCSSSDLYISQNMIPLRIHFI